MNEEKIGYDVLIKEINVSDNENIFEKIKEARNLSLFGLVGACSYLADAVPDKGSLKTVVVSILKEILRNMNIYEPIETIDYIFDKELKLDVHLLNKIINDNFSVCYLDYVYKFDATHLNSKNSYWGVRYLFKFLIELDLINFEKWIVSTKREDFKLIFIDMFFELGHWDINYESFDKATLSILKAFYVQRRFSINVHSRILPNNEDIYGLFDTKFSSKDKFFIYVYYLTKKFHGKKFTELYGDVNFNKDVQQLFNLSYIFSMEDLFSYSKLYYSPIYILIIVHISDEDRKNIFLKNIFDYLLKCYDEKYQHHLLYLDHANMIGSVAILLGEIAIKNLDSIFMKIYQRLSFPYSFCRDKYWTSGLEKMLFFLVAIAIYKKEKEESVSDYFDKLYFIKSEVEHYTDHDDKFNKVLQSIHSIFI